MWAQVTLGEVCSCGGIQTGPFGSQLHASDYVENGVPCVMPANIGDNRIVESGIARVAAHDVGRLSKYVLREGDIVYSRRGDVERRALVRPENAGWLCGTGCLRVRVGDDHNAAFVSYALGTAESREWIVRHAVGATMLNLNTSILAAVPLCVPPLDEQRAIAEVLGALDDKIAANQRVVSASDRVARAEWFAAADPENLRPLSSLARFVNGRAFTKGATGTGRVVIRIAELNSGIGSSTVYNDIDVDADNLARPGDLLFAWSGSLTAARWFRDEGIINQHIFKCVPTEGLSVAALSQALLSALDVFKGIAADKATTMGHIQRKHLDEPVSMPTEPALSIVQPTLDALWWKALAAEQESQTVAATRDALLPLLMSGKLRVQDATKKIEEVL